MSGPRSINLPTLSRRAPRVLADRPARALPHRSAAGRCPAPPQRPAGAAVLVVLAALTVTAVAVAVVVAAPEAAFAGTGGPVVLAAKNLPAVIGGLQAWLMGILAAVATLYLVLAGVYYATAGGDPTQVERAKAALKSALVGYALAVLAPVLLQVVRGIVGG